MENNNLDLAKDEQSSNNTETKIHDNQSAVSTTETTLSKRQLKKIRKREKWLKSKPEKRYL